MESNSKSDIPDISGAHAVIQALGNGNTIVVRLPTSADGLPSGAFLERWRMGKGGAIKQQSFAL